MYSKVPIGFNFYVLDSERTNIFDNDVFLMYLYRYIFSDRRNGFNIFG